MQEAETEFTPHKSVVVARSVKEKMVLKPEREGAHLQKSSKSANLKNKKSTSTQASNKDMSMKRQNVEASVKEEGEISETEEPRYKEKLDQEAREERWRDWCETNMQDHLQILKRLEKLQRTSSDLPKDEVRSLGLYRLLK